MTTRLAIGTRKGGTGKTSCTLGLATGLRLLGKSVLVIDLDSQANATAALEGAGELDLFDVLYAGEPGTLGQAITRTSWDGIDIVPGSQALARIEAESMMTPEMRLKTAAWGASELEDYDYILVDLPPSLSRLTLNGLLFADRVIAVTEPTAFAVQGLVEFLETVERVQSLPHLNPELKLEGVIVNKTSSPLTAEHEFQIGELQEAYGELVIEPFFPARTAIQESESRRVPLTKIPGRGARVLTERFGELARRIDRGE